MLGRKLFFVVEYKLKVVGVCIVEVLLVNGNLGVIVGCKFFGFIDGLI